TPLRERNIHVVASGVGRSRTGAGLDYGGPNDLFRLHLYLAKPRFACAPSIAGDVLPITLARSCFPRHESVERSSSFIRHKFDHMCIVDEAKKRGLVRNQIEWVHQIVQGCNDPNERVIGNLMVFAAMIS